MELMIWKVLTIASKKLCYYCQCYYFLDKWFKFQSSVCNRSNDVLMMSFGVNNAAILNIYAVDCCCIIFGVV